MEQCFICTICIPPSKSFFAIKHDLNLFSFISIHQTMPNFFRRFGLKELVDFDFLIICYILRIPYNIPPFPLNTQYQSKHLILFFLSNSFAIFPVNDNIHFDWSIEQVVGVNVKFGKQDINKLKIPGIVMIHFHDDLSQSLKEMF